VATLFQFRPHDAFMSYEGTQLQVRNGHVGVDINPSITNGVYFFGKMPSQYAGNQMTLTIYFTSTVGGGNIVWRGIWERGTHDLDTDSLDAAKDVTAAGPTNPGEIRTATLTFTSAEADDVVAGDWFRLIVQRVGNSGSDTNTGFGFLLGLEIQA
jgi:hypothetical protein